MKVERACGGLILASSLALATYLGVQVAVPGINRTKAFFIEPGMTEGQVHLILRREPAWGFTGGGIGNPTWDCYTDGENSIIVHYTCDRKVIDAKYENGVVANPNGQANSAD